MMREKKTRQAENCTEIIEYVLFGFKVTLAVLAVLGIIYFAVKGELKNRDKNQTVYASETAGFDFEATGDKTSGIFPENYRIYMHKQTGVYYIVSERGGVCVVVNADGTPYTGEDNKGD